MGRMGGRERRERHGTIGESAAAWLRAVDAGKSGHGWKAEEQRRASCGRWGKLYREKRSGGGVVQKTGQAGIRCPL